MNEECLICKKPLVYTETDEMMECALCQKRESSKTKCVDGHYICNDCHTKGMDALIRVCLQSDSKNPIAIIRQMMRLPFCHMHGPEHHVMVGAALLTAYKNAGGNLDLYNALLEMMSQGKKRPRRRLWLLGSLWRWNQHGNVCFHSLEIHAACQ